MGTAALLHDNGALLIIRDSVLAQMMTAKMYFVPVMRRAVQAFGRVALRGTVIIDHIVELCTQYKGHVGE